jgi:hypothetical protein
MKKRVLLGVCVALLLVPFSLYLFRTYKILKLEPVSGLHFRAARKSDFMPTVTKLSEAEISLFKQKVLKLREGEKYRNSVQIELAYPVYDVVFKESTTEGGFTYIREDYEECYNNYTVSLDEKANQGKQLISCSDTYGSQQDRYYVYLDQDIYLFTTPFPTRILYHDPHFGALPERIDGKELEEIIRSLQR